ncbi:MAG: HNH endonuclease [Desulfobacterales bacterium]|nr:HNH endonuclease [Desulfobacterales bacterium]
MMRKCPTCGREFSARVRSEKEKRSSDRQICCTRPCYNIWCVKKTRDDPSMWFDRFAGRWFVQWAENGKRIKMSRSRWIWEQAYGPIPKGYDVHHKDEDKENDTLENFELLLGEDHDNLHSFLKFSKMVDKEVEGFGVNDQL